MARFVEGPSRSWEPLARISASQSIRSLGQGSGLDVAVAGE